MTITPAEDEGMQLTDNRAVIILDPKTVPVTGQTGEIVDHVVETDQWMVLVTELQQGLCKETSNLSSVECFV